MATEDLPEIVTGKQKHTEYKASSIFGLVAFLE
jgi:hypothetical protein